MPGDPTPTTALTTAGGEPPVRLARNARERGAGELVYVTWRGQSRSPARARATRWGLVAVGVLGAITGALTWTTPVGLLAIVAWTEPGLRRQLRASALVLHGRLDEAEPTLRALADAWWIHPALRRMAQAQLAEVAAMRGDHAGSLGLARRGVGWRWPRFVQRRCRRAEVIALVNLGRVEEARAIADAHLRRPLRGDLDRLAHWTTELYLALAEGRHRLDDDALHARAIEALGVTSAHALLALLAWAHHVSGDRDQASHLLREAFARDDLLATPRSLPHLQAWIEAHRAAAEADDGR